MFSDDSSHDAGRLKFSPVFIVPTKKFKSPAVWASGRILRYTGTTLTLVIASWLSSLSSAWGRKLQWGHSENPQRTCKGSWGLIWARFRPLTALNPSYYSWNYNPGHTIYSLETSKVWLKFSGNSLDKNSLWATGSTSGINQICLNSYESPNTGLLKSHWLSWSELLNELASNVLIL